MLDFDLADRILAHPTVCLNGRAGREHLRRDRQTAHARTSERVPSTGTIPADRTLRSSLRSQPDALNNYGLLGFAA